MTFRHLRNVRGFFSDYYLGSVFGRGDGRRARKHLSDRSTDLAYRRFERIYEQAEGRCAEAAVCRERFIRPLLRDVLGFHLGESDERVHLLYTSAEAAAGGALPIAVVYCGGWDEDLDTARGGASPTRRAEQALAAENLEHGFLVTGERFRLIRAAGDGPRGAHLEVDLPGLIADEDPESFAAFFRLLHASQFIPGDDGQPPIRQVERESREHAERVSEDLKRAVFTAAEALVGGLLSDAVARGAIADVREGRNASVMSQRSLEAAHSDPTGSDPPTRRWAQPSDAELRQYRDAALTALYRVLFILYAEARDPRLDEHKIYRDAYSMHGLVDELLRDPTREWPENRSGLWSRLKALFKIYDQGLPPITPWQNIPPRGGDFFNSSTPEGQLLDVARLPDRSVARLILDLTTTAARRGVGRERVSFRELDIESLGAVYEGLLEFEPRVARETAIELRVQGRIFALSAAEVVRFCGEKQLALKGELEIVAGTAAEALHPEGSVDDDDDEDDGDESDEEDSAEAEETADGEEDTEKGVKKGAAAKLLRRLEPGAFHFVPGPSRKGSGSFYTPRLLVHDLVRHALDPMVQGKTSAEIEALRILDPACGSAHFLVEAMRFLGRELHRAYVDEHGGKEPPHFRSTLLRQGFGGQATGIGWDDHWEAPDEEARAANSEARAWCKRRIAERCLFGVDLNPTAVALARVALWIESLAGDRPLTYFEHHIRCGNSLLGTWRDRLDQPPLPSMSRTRQGQGDLFADLVRRTLREAAAARQLIDRAGDEGAVEPESIEEQAFKEHQRREAEAKLAGLHLLFDLRSASAFVPEIWNDWISLCDRVPTPERLLAYARERPWWEEFEKVRECERFFHWELEFPEIFDCQMTNHDYEMSSSNPNRQSPIDTRQLPGFDAVLGNPPWDKVLPTKHEFYARYDVLIRAYKGNDLDKRIAEIHVVRPDLQEAFAAYQDRTKTAAQVLRQSGDFPLSEARSAAAHEDVSKYFVDRAARLVRDGGAVGMLVPSVLYNGDGCVGIRRFLLNDAAIERFYGFENRKKIFPIDSRYKFVSLVFRKAGSRESGVGSRGEEASSTADSLHPTPSFHAVFMRHELSELADDGPKPWMVRITRQEIERLSPETLAFLEYRSPRDQEIVHRMHHGRPTLSSDGPGAWGVEFFTDFAHQQIYNGARDKDLFTDPRAGKLYTPQSVLGPTADSLPPTALIKQMRERHFWPVFEGKHIDQYLVGIKPVRWWLSVEQAERKYGKPPRDEPTLMFRETARNTDERTCIAAVLPTSSAASHKLSGVLVEQVDADAAATVLNSLCFDYALRMRTAGTNVSFTYMRPMPVPPAHVVNRLLRIPTQLAWERPIANRQSKIANSLTDDRDLWPLLWDANRAVAEAYDLTPNDFEHILHSFPVFARKRKEFFAYLLQRLEEWKAEVAGAARPRREYAATDEPLPEAAEAPETWGIRSESKP
jgi:hypothetical protein